MRQSLQPYLSGHTIVETIVSVAIIGILAACVITALLGKTNSIQASQVNDQSLPAIETTGDLPVPAVLGDNQDDPDNLTLYEPGLQEKSEAAARRMEWRIIQTAMDLMMVREEIHSVEVTESTSNMSEFPAGSPLYPDFVREAATQYNYRCNSQGEVFQVE